MTESPPPRPLGYETPEAPEARQSAATEPQPTWGDSPATMLLRSCHSCWLPLFVVLLCIIALGLWWVFGMIVAVWVKCGHGDTVCKMLKAPAVGMAIVLAAGLLVALAVYACKSRLAVEMRARACKMDVYTPFQQERDTLRRAMEAP